ncbi:MAG TPA: hypothetical protein QKA08_00360 [Candidatus Megaira endosymbiont of Nemacystus decipiens]|nr:hypothetical protein [Candidatus Megaera endosymbiont of Nemacystus decipiens]
MESSTDTTEEASSIEELSTTEELSYPSEDMDQMMDIENQDFNQLKISKRKDLLASKAKNDPFVSTIESNQTILEKPSKPPIFPRSNAFTMSTYLKQKPPFPRFNNFTEQKATAPLCEGGNFTDRRFPFVTQRMATRDNDTSNDDLPSPMEIDTVIPNLFGENYNTFFDI